MSLKQSHLSLEFGAWPDPGVYSEDDIERGFDAGVKAVLEILEEYEGDLKYRVATKKTNENTGKILSSYMQVIREGINKYLPTSGGEYD